MSKCELLYGDSNRMLKIVAERGEEITVQLGGMVGMSPSFELRTKAGGLGKMIGRMFAGESAFIQKFYANEAGEILIAPEYMGDIREIKLTGVEKYRLGNSAFLASDEGINIDIKSGGGRGFLSGEGLIQMEASGRGNLYVSSYGAIHEIKLSEGEKYIVDTNHLVLWESHMRYTVEMAAGLFSSLAGGEGFVCHFRGPGRILIQTRNPRDLLIKTPK